MGTAPEVDLLAVARRAAGAGAAVLAKAAMRPLSVSTKGEAGDLVTEADLRSEQAIRDLLSALRPSDSVLGEELPERQGSTGVRWVVDPLDGTTNFARGMPFYAVSVAAQNMDSGRWLVGAVSAPALNHHYYASDGGGAFRTDRHGERQLPLALTRTSSRLVGTGFSYDPDLRAEQARGLSLLMRDYTDIRRFGAAALELCLLAEGALDAFEESDLAVHDWAAGALIAAESGADVAVPAHRGGTVLARRPGRATEHQSD